MRVWLSGSTLVFSSSTSRLVSNVGKPISIHNQPQIKLSLAIPPWKLRNKQAHHAMDTLVQWSHSIWAEVWFRTKAGMHNFFEANGRKLAGVGFWRTGQRAPLYQLLRCLRERYKLPQWGPQTHFGVFWARKTHLAATFSIIIFSAEKVEMMHFD